MNDIQVWINILIHQLIDHSFWERKARTGPSAPGSKEIPTGAPNCLKGLTFVFTGELTSISREEAADLVKRYSGRVTTAPSSKTSYVVVGEDAGEKKLEKVKAFKIQVLNEDEFLDLIRKSDGKPDEDMTKMGKAVSAVSILNDDTVDNNNNIDGSSSMPKIVKTDLWTERYTPKTIRELCGNKSNIERLGEWLRQWNKGRRLEYRAVLISGPPGIGKTTSARLVSINEGFHVIEFNASDARSKKAIEGNLGEIISTKAMIETSSSSELHHRVVIMDEVDGMSAGDRGGIAQLIQLIKKSKIPIICICNDRQSTKVRSLANYCLDLRFRRPEAASIRSRIMSIAFKEGLKLQPNAIDHLVASTHSDIRQILNIVIYRGERSEKHIALGPFDIIGKYLQNQAYNSTNLAEKLDLYFHDYSIVPLMMQENYIRMAPSLARSAGGSIKDMDLRTLELVAKASESISQGDLVDHAIHRTQQQWELMPTHALFSCVRPAYFMHGGMQGLYQFPSWLGQYSKAGKADRQLAEVQARMRLRVACGKDEIRASYIPLLSQALTNPLLTAGTDGAQSVIDLLDDYYLAREDWDTIINLCIGRNNGEQLLKQIPSNVKSAFTRLYNKSTHPTVAITKNLAKRDTVSGGGGDQGGQPDLEEAFDVDDEVPAAIDSDEETMADDNLIKKVPTFKSKASGGAKGSKRGRSTKK
ncbi:replication factor RFC1 C terminal domain-containing protein [Syncephalis fuscata]|nr:replication factor RFC1 C terminal domain-containing protein [Syncephalis fuscata]